MHPFRKKARDIVIRIPHPIITVIGATAIIAALATWATALAAAFIGAMLLMGHPLVTNELFLKSIGAFIVAFLCSRTVGGFVMWADELVNDPLGLRRLRR